jgi:hypothetical protein
VKPAWSLTSYNELATGGVPAYLIRTNKKAEEARRRLFRRWLAVVNKLIVILSEDVEHEKARAFINFIVNSTAIITIYDLRGGRMCIIRSI